MKRLLFIQGEKGKPINRKIPQPGLTQSCSWW